MLLAIQFMGVMLIIAALLIGVGWWHWVLSWWQGSASPVTKQRQSRWVVALTSQGLYIGKEVQYAYAYA